MLRSVTKHFNPYKIYHKTKSFVKVLFPFVIWLCFFRGIFTQNILIFHDTLEVYANIKFFLTNLSQGVYPFWDPYVLWGAPIEMSLHVLGQFNPFLFIILLFTKMGVSFYLSFICYLVLYLFLGLLGFYALARQIFKEEKFAYLAYILLMFSSLSMIIFNQILMLFIYVPAVWFMYFLFVFTKYGRKGDFLGLILSLMIILTTYIPYYFFTVFIFFAVCMILFYFEIVKQFFIRLFIFIKSNKVIGVCCLLALLIALTPAVLAYQNSFSQDIVIPSRHKNDQQTFSKGLVVQHNQSEGRGLGVRWIFGDIFSHLENLDFRNDGILYVSVFCYFILFVGCTVRVTRKFLVLILLTLIIFFIALCGLTPIYPILFKYIFFLRYFRNLYFLIPFLVSIFILLVVAVFQQSLNPDNDLLKDKKYRYVQFLCLICVFLLFISSQENILPSTYYIILGLGLCLFFLFFSIKWIPQKIVILFLFVLILWQPVEVLHYYTQNAQNYKSEIIKKSLSYPSNQAEFFFKRPIKYKKAFINYHDEKNPIYFLHWHRISMQDSPGFITFRHGYPTRWSYYLSENIPETTYREYVKCKFKIYDDIHVVKEENINLPLEIEQFKLNLNQVALVAPSVNQENINLAANGITQERLSPETIDKSTANFQVVQFDVNQIRIKTHYKKERFLVYNDSYHQNWQAFINGQKVPIFRSNIAFKGIQLPEGENDVVFSYHPLGGQGLYVVVMIVFISFFIFLLIIQKIEKREPEI